MLQMKRAYEPAARTDGQRILIDRLWPRGLTKEQVKADEWMKELAPSTALRKWFGHDPEKWTEFQRRYKRELHEHSDVVDQLAKRASRGRVTLVFSAKDEEHNDAVVLAAVIQARMTAAGRRTSEA